MVVPITLTLVLLHTNINANQNDDAAHTLTRVEQKLLAALEAGDRAVLEDILTADFVYANEGETLNRKGAIARAAGINFTERKIELSKGTIRVYGNAAISTGTVMLRPRAKDEIRGVSQTASGSAVVNLGKLPRQEKTPPYSTQPRAVPAPMPEPHDLPVPAADVPYRYAARYIKRRGRWQMVELRLSRT